MRAATALRGRRWALVLAAVAGAAVGTVVTLASTGPTLPSSATGTTTTTAGARGTTTTTAAATPTPEPTETRPAAAEAPLLLVWTSGGLPTGLASEVAALDGVDRVSLVRGGQADLVASYDRRGAPVEEVPAGWAVPMDTLAVEPGTFATFVEGDAARVLGALRPGEVVLTETSAELRAAEPGSRIVTRSAELVVSGIVDDLSGAGAELIVHAEDAERLGVDRERYLLVAHDLERDVLQRAVVEHHRPGAAVRFRTPAETTYLRHGDAVAPQALVKATYGEFAYRDRGGRSVEISTAFVDEQLVSRVVPILGEVRCHRAIVDELAAAMDELAAANLAHLVHAEDFAGCWSPRRIAPGQPLSRHSWGIAVDLNIGGNPRGSFSTQDPRLVETMREHGFTWGGTWLVPDPGHYEAVPSPDRAAAVAETTRDRDAPGAAVSG